MNKSRLVFLFGVIFLGEKQKQKEEKRREKHRESGQEREREKERRKVEEERKEGCPSGVISALDWNLKVAGSIPSPTHRGIIHHKNYKMLALKVIFKVFNALMNRADLLYNT